HRKIREHLFEQRTFLFFHDAVAVEPGAQILHDREQAENSPVFRHIADAEARELVWRHAGDRVALEQNLAVARLHQAHDRLERRAFAHTIAAEQADHFALT